MDKFCGSDLLETFNNLGINTGNVSKLTIDSWFDTDCEATKEMLNWLCTNLSKDNVLTARENEVYEEMLETNSLLTGKQYDAALLNLQTNYPGILDYDKNVFEVECMEDELSILLDEERELEQQMNLSRNLNKKLSKELNEAAEEELISNIQKKNAQENCSKLSRKLQEAHEKLQLQISRYAVHLNEFEHSSPSTFISHMPIKKCDQYYNDIVSCVDLFVKQEYEVLPMVRTAKKKLLKESCSNVDFAGDELEVLSQRISKSCQNYLWAQITEERLRAEINFLKTLNLNDIVSTLPLDDSFQVTLEARVLFKEELLKGADANIKRIAEQISSSFVNQPKIASIENTIRLNQKKLESIEQVDRKVAEMLVRHAVLFLLLEQEKKDVLITDKFFRDVHHYIIHNLHSCQLRTEAMTKVINDHYIYKNVPIEQQFKLLSLIKALLTNGNDDNLNNASAVDVVNNFISECSQIEQRVFVNDYREHRQFSKQIEQQIEVMQKFLLCGPANQMVVIPQQVFDHFGQINKLLEARTATLRNSVQLLNDAEKKLSESKWFKMRRHLWMWFVLEPKKVLLAINQIEMAVEKK